MLTSPRLRYQPLAVDQLDDFHLLVADPYVRRYLMDDNLFDRAWTAARIADSQMLFARRGVGLWLARREGTAGALVGFCGFLELPDELQPQLVYALFPTFTGQGYAREMATAAIAHARRQPGFELIHAAVDEMNTASIRVLERLGFQRSGAHTGAFGDVFEFQLGPAQ
jgi:[ribosomal protein S5]-alanine N-acetyltransferase